MVEPVVGHGVSREEVIAAYAAFLDRAPESEAAIALHRRFLNWNALAQNMFRSREFGARAQRFLFANQVYLGYVPADLEVFPQFSRYSGPGMPGFVTNFLGVKVRTAFSTTLKPLDGQVQGYPVPVGGLLAETVEYIGALRSVLSAAGHYTMLECGAGFAPWMAITAAAAKQHGLLDLRLYGIEGDAGHFSFMSQHLGDNAIDPAKCHLIHGAVGVAPGRTKWAVIDDAAAAYGGRPVDDGLIDYHGRPQSRVVELEVHSINDLLRKEPVWDLVHVDIQGGEAELCRGGIETMNQRVRRVVIGTHSRALDGEVMSTFHAAAWALENEKPTIMAWRQGAPTLETMARVDGTQVWRNPRLVGPPAV